MIDSAHQLRLRILTGTHAGAELSLSQGDYEIGSDAGCDAVISDWTYRRSRFSVTYVGAGEYAIKFEDASLAAPFGINEPRCIGQVAVVVSLANDDRPRPSDLELMTQMLAPPAPVVERRSGKGKWIGAALVVMAAAATSAFTLHGATPKPVTKVASKDEPPLLKVRHAVGKLRYPNIQIVEEGNSIVVTGLLKDVTERQALATQLAAVKGVSIQHRYAVESELIAAISDAVAQPGIIVRHIHGGRFEIGGNVTPAMRQRIDLDKLKTDLGPLVKSLAFEEPKRNPDMDAEFDEAQMKKGYQFKIAADGTKYFIPH